MNRSAPTAYKIIECPRDAMQGWSHFIPTEKKAEYINALMQVGFDTIDFGSFVSPKAIPQMADTKEVIKKLNLDRTTSKLLAIVANVRGAQEAIVFDEISYIGFPFSISPTFQLRNTNSTIEESVLRVEEIQELCAANNKKLVVYISMGFGNPYGDAYDSEVLERWTDSLVKMGISIISLADTVGMATPAQIRIALQTLIPKYPHIEFGVHLHATADGSEEKMEAAIAAGCTRMDSALKGIGGCPMAGDELVGNMPTEMVIRYLKSKGIAPAIDETALAHCLQLANDIFV